MADNDEPDYLSWSPSKPADPEPVVDPAPTYTPPEPPVVAEPEPQPVITRNEDRYEESQVEESEPVDEPVAAASAPETYEAPTTDGTGFVDAHGFYKQNRPLGEMTFDIAALTGEERRVLSYRLAELNVTHHIEGLAVVATTDAATTVQGEIDRLVSAPPIAEERVEPEEIVVPPSEDVEEVIEQLDEDEDEVVFDLASLSTEERRHLTMRLTGAGIAHIWEVATDLVVSVKDAPAIEGYLDEVRNPHGFADEEIIEFEDDEDVDDEAVYAAMSNLYVAADKLMQRPTDPSARTAFYDATDDVDGLPAPFGFDPRVWSQVQELANSIADVMDAEGPDDTIATDSRTLRQLLVNYV